MTKIYIATHTDFESPVHHPVYEVLDSRRLFATDVAPNGIDALFYSELLSYKYLADHPNLLPDIVGFCGYRKYYSFMDDVPDIESLIIQRGCIATTPHHTCRTLANHQKQSISVYDQYARCFFFGDMDVMKAVVQLRHPELWATFNSMLAGDWLYTCNMFIMRRCDFLEMMHVVWDCLDAWLEAVGTDVYRRIIQHEACYLQKPSGTLRQPEHQFRIGGNLGERIVSAFIMRYFPQAITYDIVFTERARRHRPLII